VQLNGREIARWQTPIAGNESPRWYFVAEVESAQPGAAALAMRRVIY